ncbi:MAG: hypothetical protein WD623_05480 [Marinobacter sp.]|uniref:hypothetical protein n=1 Tax=Marinobacter sp. TaxID=50741 RepID=UPI0034A040DC
MTSQHTLRKWLLLLTAAASLSLAGCGGGSSSGSASQNDNTPDEDIRAVAGTAAAGAPISGFVGARDLNSETVNTNINSDGTFALDLSALQPPVLLFASGISGGNAYQLLSVVFEDDLHGTVNITPLTDLIIGNAVGQAPAEFFNNPDFALIAQESVETQEAALRTRLKPLLDGLGVADDFDLRNSPFLADRSGFDAVLDLIEVQVDPAANTATIVNRVNREQSITNSFTQPDSDTTPLEVDEQTLNDGLSKLQTAGALASAAATALDTNDRATLETLLADDFLNNGEFGAEWLDRLLGTEDAGELANDLRDWSLETVENSTVNLNVGSPNGPWQAIDDNGDLKLRGNQVQFLAYSEATHIVENGAEPAVVREIATSLLASNPIAELGTVANSDVTVSGPQGTPFNGPLEEGFGDRFSTFFVIGPNDLGQIQTGDEYTFTWVGPSASAQSTYTVRRGQPRLSEGAPEITSTSADLTAAQYSFEWTLPPGYESVSVRNNFTGQTPGGQGGGFTGNPLANEARSFTGDLPDGFSPQTDDELRLIARDPYGVFVAARLINPFADQVPTVQQDRLLGSWVYEEGTNKRNILSFINETHYVIFHEHDDSESQTPGSGEYGTYVWNVAAGTIAFDTEIESDGGGGLNSRTAESVELLDDTLALGLDDGSIEFSRVSDASNQLVGGRLYYEASSNNNNVLTILNDSEYALVHTNNQETYPGEAVQALSGEFGTYTYASGVFSVTGATVDSDGDGGLYSEGGEQFSAPMTVESDGSLAFNPATEDAFTFDKP